MTTAPSGTVTFLFTDIQGSTSLWQDDPESMEIALKRHDEILRKAVNQAGGYVFKTVGDAFCCVFSKAEDAIRSALAAQLVLQEEPWGTPRPLRVRMSLHTGAARERDNDYFGPTVNRVARIESLAHGGQVVMSRVTAELVRDLLPEGVKLEEKGAHRLKDLARPEEIFQLIHPDLPSLFPPLRSMDVLPNNLPIQATPLIGREKEIEALLGYFRDPECRLVSVVGPGGMGKTRIALQVAADLVDKHRDGTWFVDLSSVTRPEGVALAAGSVLGIPQDTDQDPVEHVAAALREKSILLVLDNFEQVTGAFAVVVRWLACSPEARFLVTSREPLNVRGEHVFHLPPMSLPDPGKGGVLSQFEATRLFIDRACAANPDFTVDNENAPVVAEICSRLDGIPLAIELAAARIRLLEPKAILKRLDSRLRLLTGGPNDLPDRHKTLRACIDWSYDLLNETERALFRRISVFHGGISLESAASVLEPLCCEELDVIDGLESLADKSLIFHKAPLNDEPFFGILETISEYGRQRLAESEEDMDALDRHAAHFLRLVNGAGEAWNGPEQKSCFHRISANQENILQAMNHLAVRNATGDVISMVRSLVPFWVQKSEFSIGRAWIAAAKRICPDPGNRDSASLAMLSGWLSWAAGNFSDAETDLVKAAGLFTRIGDDAGRIRTELHLSITYFLQGRIPESLSACETVAGAAERFGDPDLLADVEQVLGNIAWVKKGDHEKAREHYARALETYRSAGNEFKAAITINNTGTIDRQLGDVEAAELKFKAALPVLEDFGMFHYLRYTLCNLGELCLATGRFTDALAWFEDVKKTALRKFDYPYVACGLIGIAESYLGLGDRDLAEQHAQEAADVAGRLGDTVELGMAHRVLGQVAAAREDRAEARRFFESAERILSELEEIEELAKVRAEREKLRDTGGTG